MEIFLSQYIQDVIENYKILSVEEKPGGAADLWNQTKQQLARILRAGDMPGNGTVLLRSGKCVLLCQLCYH